jgi:fatty-acid desaturase
LSLKNDRTFNTPLRGRTTFFMVLFHIGAVGALFMFNWKAVALATLLYWIAGGPGVGVGYHRLLTHRGFKTYKWVEYLLTIFATLSLEGGPFFWVAIHRVHHQNADKEGDPHSPRDGGFWAHVGWIISGRSMTNHSPELLPYVPDLRKDKFHAWLSEWHWVPITVLAVILMLTGGPVYVMWCIFFRTVFGLHSTWLVNSATHMWGSRRFLTSDTSRNSFWVAIFSFGEGWHNNHHAHPQCARHGLRWYEVDVNWYVIRVLSTLGLVWDVKEPKFKKVPQRIAAEKPVEQVAPSFGD